MSEWLAPVAPFAIPGGPLDVYQSIQRLEPGAWVAAHTHEGPESGIVLTGALARFEDGGTRTFDAGQPFVTAGGVVHATGNPFATVAEAITLHIVRAGSAFSAPCSCAAAPAPQPGSSNPMRSIFRDIALAARRVQPYHVRRVLGAALPIRSAGGVLLVTVLAGSIMLRGEVLERGAFRSSTEDGSLDPLVHPAEVVVTWLQVA